MLLIIRDKHMKTAVSQHFILMRTAAMQRSREQHVLARCGDTGAFTGCWEGSMAGPQNIKPRVLTHSSESTCSWIPQRIGSKSMCRVVEGGGWRAGVRGMGS